MKSFFIARQNSSGTLDIISDTGPYENQKIAEEVAITIQRTNTDTSFFILEVVSFTSPEVKVHLNTVSKL